MGSDIKVPEMLACVDRELAFRGRCYPRWVAQGKLKQEKADREILVMQAVRAVLERLQK